MKTIIVRIAIALFWPGILLACGVENAIMDGHYWYGLLGLVPILCCVAFHFYPDELEKECQKIKKILKSLK